MSYLYLYLFLTTFTSVSLLWHSYRLRKAERALQHIQASIPYVKHFAIELSGKWSYNTLDTLLFNIDSIQRATDAVIGPEVPSNHIVERFQPLEVPSKTPESNADKNHLLKV